MSQLDSNRKGSEKSAWQILIDMPVWLALLASFAFFWIPLAIKLARVVLGEDLQTASQIGDAVDGLTAPILGLLNAVLVFTAFRQQIAVNEFQFTAHQDQLIEIRNSNQQQEKAVEAQIQAINLEKELYQTRIEHELLSEIEEYIIVLRGETEYKSQPVVGNPTYYFGCNSITSLASENGINYIIGNHKDFYSTILPSSKSDFQNAIRLYQRYLEAIKIWYTKLDNSKLSMEQKQLHLLKLRRLAPFNELTLSRYEHYQIIIPRADVRDKIKEIEMEIMAISKKYSIANSA